MINVHIPTFNVRYRTLNFSNSPFRLIIKSNVTNGMILAYEFYSALVLRSLLIVHKPVTR
jgi:hypothetical protein